MNTRAALALSAAVLLATALASFAVGYWYSSLEQYVLIQFALAGAWLLVGAMLVVRWGATARVAACSLVALSAPFALFYPGQMAYLLLSFAIQGFV